MILVDAGEHSGGNGGGEARAVRGHVENEVTQVSASWLSEGSFSARSCLRLPPRLGQSAAWAALAGNTF